ncbi:MAG: DUF285 domain-containing protein [Lachnospiraceae bacterium]|nr:DUF285 domain-containing protein [Lachnospiraceae bacterium]
MKRFPVMLFSVVIAAAAFTVTDVYAEEILGNDIDRSAKEPVEITENTITPDTDSIASGTWGTCPWEIDSEGTLTVSPGEGVSGYHSPWIDHKDDVKKVIFAEEDGRKVKAPENAYYLFSGMYKIESIDLRGMDASNIKDFQSAFAGCTSLQSVDVTGLDTSHITMIPGLFNGCSSLTALTGFDELDLSGVTYMASVFEGCSRPQMIDMSCLAGAQITSAFGAFKGCTGVTAINFAGIDTSQMNEAWEMFSGCSSLQTIYVGDEWSTAGLGDDEETRKYVSRDMFKGCTSLVGGAGTVFNSSHTDYEYARVDGGPDSETPGYFTYKEAVVPTSIAGAAVTLSQTSFIYNGSVQKPTVRSVVLGGTDLEEGTDYDVRYQDVNSKEVGEYAVYVDGKGNYKGTVSAVYNITDPEPDPTKVAAPAGKTLTYNGRMQTGVDGGTGYTLSGTTSAVNAGSYQATATLQNGYIWSDGTRAAKTINWKINKADVSVTPPTGKTCTYNGKEQTGVAAGDGYTLSGTISATNAGDYSAKATLVNDPNRTYKWSDGSDAAKTINWKIDKAENTMTAAAAKATFSVKYNAGKAVTTVESVKVNDAKGKVTYSNVSTNATAKKFKADANNAKITIPKATKAGTYEVKINITAAGDNNYKPGSMTVSFKIKVNKAANPLTIKAKKSSNKITYSENKAKVLKAKDAYTIKKKGQGKVTYTLASAVNNKKKNVKNKFKVAKSTGNITLKKGLEKSTYTVKVKVKAAGNKNYKSATKTVKLKIMVK